MSSAPRIQRTETQTSQQVATPERERRIISVVELNKRKIAAGGNPALALPKPILESDKINLLVVSCTVEEANVLSLKVQDDVRGNCGYSKVVIIGEEGAIVIFQILKPQAGYSNHIRHIPVYCIVKDNTMVVVDPATPEACKIFTGSPVTMGSVYTRDNPLCCNYYSYKSKVLAPYLRLIGPSTLFSDGLNEDEERMVDNCKVRILVTKSAEMYKRYKDSVELLTLNCSIDEEWMECLLDAEIEIVTGQYLVKGLKSPLSVVILPTKNINNTIRTLEVRRITLHCEDRQTHTIPYSAIKGLDNVTVTFGERVHYMICEDDVGDAIAHPPINYEMETNVSRTKLSTGKLERCTTTKKVAIY